MRKTRGWTGVSLKLFQFIAFANLLSANELWNDSEDTLPPELVSAIPVPGPADAQDHRDKCTLSSCGSFDVCGDPRCSVHVYYFLQIRDLSASGAPSGVWKVSIRLGSPTAHQNNMSSDVRGDADVDPRFFVVSSVEFTHGRPPLGLTHEGDQLLVAASLDGYAEPGAWYLDSVVLVDSSNNAAVVDRWQLAALSSNLDTQIASLQVAACRGTCQGREAACQIFQDGPGKEVWWSCSDDAVQCCSTCAPQGSVLGELASECAGAFRLPLPSCGCFDGNVSTMWHCDAAETVLQNLAAPLPCWTSSGYQESPRCRGANGTRAACSVRGQQRIPPAAAPKPDNEPTPTSQAQPTPRSWSDRATTSVAETPPPSEQPTKTVGSQVEDGGGSSGGSGGSRVSAGMGLAVAVAALVFLCLFFLFFSRRILRACSALLRSSGKPPSPRRDSAAPLVATAVVPLDADAAAAASRSARPSSVALREATGSPNGRTGGRGSADSVEAWPEEPSESIRTNARELLLQEMAREAGVDLWHRPNTADQAPAKRALDMGFDRRVAREMSKDGGGSAKWMPYGEEQDMHGAATSVRSWAAGARESTDSRERNAMHDPTSVSLTASEARKFARERRRKVNRGLLGNLPGLVGSQDGECCVCMDAQADVRLVPCAHVAMCNECAQHMMRDKQPCPLCRCQVEGILPTGRPKSKP